MVQLNISSTQMIREEDYYEESRKRRIMAKQKIRTDALPATPPARKKFHVRDLKTVLPKTPTQKKFFEDYTSLPEGHKFLIGSAGTGKTFISTYQGLKDVLDPATPYDKLLIVRSVVPSLEIGFLPGDIEEKTAAYESPYISMCNELFSFSNSYENLKASGYIEFLPTSFLRGQTFNDCIILVDEMQNMTFGELDTIITRVGHNAKIIFCGDHRQNDLLNKRNTQSSGLHDFHEIIRSMRKHFSIFEFGHDDIVRSGLVKEYIIKKETLFFRDEDEEYFCSPKKS